MTGRWAAVADPDLGGLRWPLRLRCRPPDPPTMAGCHPQRRHVARGMCMACYQRWWRRQAGDG